MTYKLKIDPNYPLFSPYYFKSSRWGHTQGRDKFTKERPKIMKKLVRTVKRTRGEITSIRSGFSGNEWVKIITVAG